MLRRRRPPVSEIAFSFDSFLDLVANVVGIILRLILVAWIGARTYTGVFQPPEESGDEVLEMALLDTDELPTTEEEKKALEEARQQLASARAALLEQLRQRDALIARKPTSPQKEDLQGATKRTDQRLHSLASQRRTVEAEEASTNLSVAEIRKRAEELAAELKALRSEPEKKHVLRYQTPVARTVQSEELHFEIRNGRITFLDVEALLREIRQGLPRRGELLKTQWEVRDETGPVGAFKLRYVVARERELIDSVTSSLVPNDRTNYRYGVDGWIAVPVQAARGETVEQALQEASQFRGIIDRLDPLQTAVTFWVYPDSFAAYRSLRDWCLRRDLLVAGRPLPENQPIASSRQGTASRGQ